MTVSEATGDLFDQDTWTIRGEAYPYPVDVLGHGVNCQGFMGAGIANEFRKRYPEMYEKYKQMCDQDFLKPGMVYPWVDYTTLSGKPFWIFNIASQFNTGRAANINYLRAGLLSCRFYMEDRGLNHLALPRIGAGIGGLSWNHVKSVVHDVFDDNSGCVDNQPHVTLVSLEGS